MGIATTAVLNEYLERKEQIAYRLCLGLMNLAKQYGEARLELACKKALSIKATRYHNLASILKNKTEEQHCDQLDKNEEETALPTHNNLRGAIYYKNLAFKQTIN